MIKKLLCNYAAPETKIVDVVLEKGIAFTISKDGSDILELEEGDGWGDF